MSEHKRELSRDTELPSKVGGGVVLLLLCRLALVLLVQHGECSSGHGQRGPQAERLHFPGKLGTGDVVSFTRQCTTLTSLTVEFKECSQPVNLDQPNTACTTHTNPVKGLWTLQPSLLTECKLCTMYVVMFSAPPQGPQGLTSEPWIDRCNDWRKVTMVILKGYMHI